MDVRTTTTTTTTENKNHYPVQPICRNHYDYLFDLLELRRGRERSLRKSVSIFAPPYFPTKKNTIHTNSHTRACLRPGCYVNLLKLTKQNRTVFQCPGETKICVNYQENQTKPCQVTIFRGDCVEIKTKLKHFSVKQKRCQGERFHTKNKRSIHKHSLDSHSSYRYYCGIAEVKLCT